MGAGVTGIGHLILTVDDMDRAVGFYRDLLGFPVVGAVDPVWTVVDAHGVPLTLYRVAGAPRLALGPDQDDSPFFFHVANFDSTAAALEAAGVRVKRTDRRQGIAWDPAGNVLGFHDHREG
ncbi:MAG: VOC family protein [Thermoplasmata archaeon]|nr:VOC family protein [Thermoplasmata archaeon]